MKAQELRDIMQKTILEKENARPSEVLQELYDAMTDCAKNGYDHIDYKFVDNELIINAVLSMIKSEGYTIEYLYYRKDTARISWKK